MATTATDVENEKNEVLLALLHKIKAGIGNATPAGVEHYANAYALVKSGTPSPSIYVTTK